MTANFIDCHRALADADGDLGAAFSENGLHLNAAGYAQMAQALRTCATVSALI